MAMPTGSLKEKQVVIVCLTDDPYYKKSINDIIAFSQDLSYKVQGLDLLLVICPESLAYCMQSGYAQGTHFIIRRDPIDLWARDFGLVLPHLQVKFRYKPKYLKKSDAEYVDEQLMNLLGQHGVGITKTNTVLDGGNVVDNGKYKAIVTERILKENKGRSKSDLKEELERLLQAQICFIPDPEDSTGHSDGVVSFVEENTLLIGEFEGDGFFEDVKSIVSRDFPDLTIKKLPCFYSKGKFKDFDSAIGCYVNILVTNNAAYMPTFAKPQSDRAALEILQSATSRRVVGVDTSKLGHMGGNVRCMTWQVNSTHPVAVSLLRGSNVVR